MTAFQKAGAAQDGVAVLQPLSLEARRRGGALHKHKLEIHQREQEVEEDGAAALLPLLLRSWPPRRCPAQHEFQVRSKNRRSSRKVLRMSSFWLVAGEVLCMQKVSRCLATNTAAAGALGRHCDSAAARAGHAGFWLMHCSGLASSCLQGREWSSTRACRARPKQSLGFRA